MDMSKGIFVNGMQCNECEQVVENSLERVDLVEEASADAETGAVRLTISDSGSPSADRLVEAVDHAGYEADIPGD